MAAAKDELQPCLDYIVKQFKSLRGYERIWVMCRLEDACMPFELRFFGTYLEHLARKDFASIRQAENESNNLTDERCAELSNFADKNNLQILILYLSLLNSGNINVAYKFFKILSNMDDVHKLLKSEACVTDVNILEMLLTLYTLAINHPAFMTKEKVIFEKIYAIIERDKDMRIQNLYESKQQVTQTRNNTDLSASSVVKNEEYNSLPREGGYKSQNASQSYPQPVSSPKAEDLSLQLQQQLNVSAPPPGAQSSRLNWQYAAPAANPQNNSDSVAPYPAVGRALSPSKSETQSRPPSPPGLKERSFSAPYVKCVQPFYIPFPPPLQMQPPNIAEVNADYIAATADPHLSYQTTSYNVDQFATDPRKYVDSTVGVTSENWSYNNAVPPTTTRCSCCPPVVSNGFANYAPTRPPMQMGIQETVKSESLDGSGSASSEQSIPDETGSVEYRERSTNSAPPSVWTSESPDGRDPKGALSDGDADSDERTLPKESPLPPSLPVTRHSPPVTRLSPAGRQLVRGGSLGRQDRSSPRQNYCNSEIHRMENRRSSESNVNRPTMEEMRKTIPVDSMAASYMAYSAHSGIVSSSCAAPINTSYAPPAQFHYLRANNGGGSGGYLPMIRPMPFGNGGSDLLYHHGGYPQPQQITTTYSFGAPLYSTPPPPLLMPPAKMCCYNCGSPDHHASVCQQETMDDTSKRNQFKLNYLPEDE